MAGLFEVLAADDTERQTKKRVAIRIAHKRAEERFGSFVRAADNSADQEARLELIKEELDDLVTATCAEYEVEPKHILEAVHSTFVPVRVHAPKEASVHEARRPKLCPYHKEVMDISLAQGEPRAGYDAMAQHAWSNQHCQGTEYEGGKCNFKPDMTTQSYWDEKAEKRQERREEREREQAEVNQSEQLSEEQEAPDTSAEPIDDNVVEVDFEGAEPSESIEETETETEAPEVPMAMAASVKEALTAKDFVLVADAIAKSPVEDKAGLAEHFASYLSHTNPNFDYDRFIVAATGSPGGRDQFRGPGGPDTQVPLTSRTADTPLHQESESLCPKCDGTGKITSGSFCTYCGGTGNLKGDKSPYQSRTAEQKEHLKGVDSDKRQRQYEHIKKSCLEDGKSEEECKELAARTVNKQRAEKGETKSKVASPEKQRMRQGKEAKIAVEVPLNEMGEDPDDWREFAEQIPEDSLDTQEAEIYAEANEAWLRGTPIQEITERMSRYFIKDLDWDEEHTDEMIKDWVSDKLNSTESSARIAEALKTVKVDEGSETPSPKIDKSRVPEDGQKVVETESEGSPHPTRRKDPIEPIDYDNDDRFEETDAVLEKQEVTKNTAPNPTKDNKGWGGVPTSPPDQKAAAHGEPPNLHGTGPDYCGVCGDSIWEPGSDIHNHNQDEAIQMERRQKGTPCEYCQGLGMEGENAPCPECHGAGYVPQDNQQMKGNPLVEDTNYDMYDAVDRPDLRHRSSFASDEEILSAIAAHK